MDPSSGLGNPAPALDDGSAAPDPRGVRDFRGELSTWVEHALLGLLFLAPGVLLLVRTPDLLLGTACVAGGGAVTAYSAYRVIALGRNRADMQEASLERDFGI